jgi:hypothetical protein
MMVMRLSTLLASAALSGLLATSALAQGRQDFTLINRTGYQIDRVHVSSSQQRSWGPDILGRGVLVNNATINITFPQKSNECMWDMRVVYNDGDQSEWRQLNLCRISRVTLYWNRREGTTRAVTE